MNGDTGQMTEIGSQIPDGKGKKVRGWEVVKVKRDP